MLLLSARVWLRIAWATLLLSPWRSITRSRLRRWFNPFIQYPLLPYREQKSGGSETKRGLRRFSGVGGHGVSQESKAKRLFCTPAPVMGRIGDSNWAPCCAAAQTWCFPGDYLHHTPESAYFTPSNIRSQLCHDQRKHGVKRCRRNRPIT